MAVGDDAIAAGLPIVPNTGESGKVKYGAQEINRTRDQVAQTRASLPTGHAGYRASAGITSGTGSPVGGVDGDIYFQILP